MTKLGLDGFPRTKEDDEKISKDVAHCFSTPNGIEVLKYLRSITIDAVSGANISDSELRHLEGQRFIIGLLSSRANHGSTIKSKEGKNERRSCN